MVFKQFTQGLMFSVMILIIEFACPPPSFFLATSAIKKCDGLFYYKVRCSVITKCDKCYFKVRQALQSEKILLQKVRQNALTEARSGGLIRTESSKRIQLRLFKQISLVIGS